MYVASLLILVGGSGRSDPVFLVSGVVLALAACGVSLFLALRGRGDRPRPPIVNWAIGGLLGFYLLVAAAAAAAGPSTPSPVCSPESSRSPACAC